ncbi:MAG TPA: preprotein translocase subunit YajC [Acetobacteraceae bacterium]|nr:preprotein translocase subunit YajC [Acetobacteraceae bacterium]
MLITPAYAQDLTGALGGATQFLPLVLIFVVFYFLLIRPQQQRQKETKQMIAALKRGDRVVTGGGIVGVISRVPAAGEAPSAEVEVEIAPNIKVMVLRDTITQVIRPVAANDTKPAASKATKAS